MILQSFTLKPNNMCLYSRTKVAKKATKDIKVYKSLDRTFGLAEEMVIGNKRYRVQEQKLTAKHHAGFEYQVGKLNTTTLQILDHWGSGAHAVKVERAFHAYPSLAICKKHEHTGIFVECTIPKGSLYLTGTNNGTSKGICSNQLIVTKIV